MSGFTSRLRGALDKDAEINRSGLSRRRLSDAFEKDQEFKLIQAVEAELIQAVEAELIKDVEVYEKKQDLMDRIKAGFENNSIVEENKVRLAALKNYVTEDNFRKNEEKLINAKDRLMRFRSIRKDEGSSNSKKGGRGKSRRRRQNKNKTKKRNAFYK